jgi:hypothetical protein
MCFSNAFCPQGLKDFMLERVKHYLKMGPVWSILWWLEAESSNFSCVTPKENLVKQQTSVCDENFISHFNLCDCLLAGMLWCWWT